MKKLRMGIIGTGMAFERLHYPAYQKLSDKFEIRALCDIDFQKTDKWRKLLNLLPKDCYRDFHEMIRRKDLDAFDIMVPIELNYEVTEEVAQAGKPIITEKPLGATKKQALDARDLPKRFNIPIMVAENYRYNEDINIIRDLVRTQEAGRVYYFIQNRFVDFPNEMTKNKFSAREWRQHPEFPGGVFYDTGVHEIAALQHIFGAIESVHAFGVKQEEDFSPYSVIQTNLLFKSGVTGQFTFFCAGKETQRPLIGLRIFCDNGMIYLEERDCGTINVFYNDGGSKQIPYQPQMGFYHELLNFYKAASGKEPLAVTPELEYGDALAIFAILDSLENRKEVKVAARANYEPAYQ